MRILATFALIAAALPAVAQEVSDTADGNFGGPAKDGYFYSAEVYRNSEYLALRIWEGNMAMQSLNLDNPRFAYTPVGGREWLEALPEGPLVLYTESKNDGYLYTTRTMITHVDNMIAVTGYNTYNNQLPKGMALPDNTMRCFSEGCYSCEAYLWGGVALITGDAIDAPVSYDDMNASLWGPNRATELGLCPGTN